MNIWPKKISTKRTLRWTFPAAIATLAIGSATLPTTFAATNTNNSIPPTPKMLLNQALSSKVPPLSGTLQLNSHLGISSLLSSFGNGQNSSNSTLSLLSGSHNIGIWENGPKQFRIAIYSPLSEVDIIRNHSSLWLWNSKSLTATHASLANKTALGHSHKNNKSMMPTTALTNKLLTHLGSSATTKVLGPTQIAGQNAYTLSVSPNSSSSLISSIQVGIDQSNGMVLKVAVIPKGATAPAFSLGFSSISFASPSNSIFSFTPPKNSNLKELASKPLAQKASSNKTHFRSISKNPLGLQILNKGFGTKVAALPVASLPAKDLKMLNMIASHGQTVTGSFGTGKVITTSLINMLITPKYIFIGPVNTTTLETSAASKF